MSQVSTARRPARRSAAYRSSYSVTKATAKAKAPRFSVEEIRASTENANRLSLRHDGQDWPSIDVEWAPASRTACIPMEDQATAYSVAVDIPAEQCFWEIKGETLNGLRLELAEGLDAQAAYLERAARYLRAHAEMCRNMAKREGGAVR